MGHQYHFHLETHACLCVPTEDGYTVYSSTQWTANVQTAVAGVLGITNNRYIPSLTDLVLVSEFTSLAAVLM